MVVFTERNKWGGQRMSNMGSWFVPQRTICFELGILSLAWSLKERERERKDRRWKEGEWEPRGRRRREKEKGKEGNRKGGRKGRQEERKSLEFLEPSYLVWIQDLLLWTGSPRICEIIFLGFIMPVCRMSNKSTYFMGYTMFIKECFGLH